MPEYHLPGKQTEAFRALDEFTQGYVEAMFFTENDTDEVPAEAGFYDLAAESVETIKRECLVFQAQAFRLFPELGHEGENPWEDKKAGRDFWYTRNGHGCGFWDGDWDEPHGEGLTKLSKAFREVYLYVGADAHLHVN